MNKINLVIFGTKKNFDRSKYRLRDQARETGWFDKIYVYGEDDVRKKWYNGGDILNEKHAKHETNSYFSYYWWKPVATLKALNAIQENEILLYLDAGCALNMKGVERFQEYVNLCDQGPGFLGFGASRKNYRPGWPQYPNEMMHTKRDVLKLLDCDEPVYVETSQITAGIFFVKKNDFGMSLISDWDKLAGIDFYFNDCPGFHDNYPTFKGHKHDQSILSLLVKKRWDLLDDYLLDQRKVSNARIYDSKFEEPIKVMRLRDEHEKNQNIWNYPNAPFSTDIL